MVQFNLLPDVKINYIKARRAKRTIMMSSILVSGVALFLFVFMFIVVNGVQKKHLSDLSTDIAQSKSQLKSKPDLAKILTIQSQLNSLTQLHKDKPVASRVLGFMQKVTPQNVSISGLTVTFKDQTMKITGSADSLESVNTFVDTLKFTDYVLTPLNSTDGSSASAPKPAFSQVVLTSFTVASNTQSDKNKAVSYGVTLKFAQPLFLSDKNADLQVNKQITTRSEVEKPSAVFQAAPSATGGTN